MNVCATLEKRRVYSISSLGVDIYPITVSWKRREFKTPKRMLYIGWRSVYEGFVRRGGYEEGDYFQLQNTLVVWVFVAHEHANMVYVLPKDCEANQS
jgi:hypothetical protein